MALFKSYSRSALETFGCPHRYREIYEFGRRDTSPEAMRGAAYHDAKARYIGKLAAAQVKSDHDLAKQALEEALCENLLTEPLMRDVEDVFWKMAEKFELNLQAFLLAEVKQSDEEFVFIPDLVYAHSSNGEPWELEILDDKTWFAAMTEEQARQEFQSRYYLWRARYIWPGFPRYTMTYVFPRLGMKSVTISLSDAELDDFGRHVMALVAGIKRADETGYWPAIAGSHCRFCRSQCPIADDRARLPIRTADYGEAQVLAARLLTMEIEVKAIRKALSGFASVEGPILINGMSFEMAETVARTWPLDVVMAVLDEHGVEEPPADIKLSASTLKSYLTTKKHRAIGAALEPLAHEKPGYRAAWKKRIDDPVTDVSEAEEVTE